MDSLTKFRIAMEIIRTTVALLAVSINGYVLWHIMHAPK